MTYLRTPLNQLVAPTSSLSLNNQKITSLGEPTVASDAATKAYCDAVAQGLDVKESVRVSTTAAGTLATSFENADTIDGVALVTGNRILIKNQAAGAENGIYTVNASGAPTRSTDADTDAEVDPGLYTFVEEGTVNADTGWVLTTNDPITLGTTALVFTQFSGGSGSGIPATTFDAKGDLLAASAADTTARLAVGTDGQVLTADSTQTTGLGWGTAGGAPVAATYITQTTHGGLSAEQAVNSLTDGVLKHSSGVLARAVPGTDYYVPGGADVTLADGGTGTSLVDPGADRIAFWDDSASTMNWLIPGTGLIISGATLTATATGGTGIYIDVTQPPYNAAGDGVTDDRAAIQAAINDLPQSSQGVGGTIYFPGGAYRIVASGGIGINLNGKYGVRLLGEGGISYNEDASEYVGSALITGTTGMTLVSCSQEFVNPHGPICEYLNFIDHTAPTHSSTLFKIRGANHWAFKNCTFRDGLRGLELDSADDALDCAWGILENPVFMRNSVGLYGHSPMHFACSGGDFACDAGQFGAKLFAGSQDNAFLGTKFNGAGTGIWIQGSRTKMIGCFFELVNPGIHLVGSGILNKLIANTGVGGGTGTGIWVEDATVSNTALIANDWSNVTNRIIDNGIYSHRDDVHEVKLTYSGGKMGFYGTTPIVRPAVAVTAAGIHAALVNLGLITA